jgi:hypothetical protein
MDTMQQGVRFHHWAFGLLAVTACHRADPGAAGAGGSPLGVAMQRAREAARGTLPLDAAPDPPPPPLTGVAADCASLCTKNTELRCGNLQACIAFCTEYGSLEPCVSKLGTYVQCAKAEPIQHWECDPALSPALKTGYCDKERKDFTQCASAKRSR